MADWSRARILRAAEEWIWLPEGAERSDRDGVTMIRYPDWAGLGVQVIGCRSASSPAEVVEQVRATAVQWRASTVRWWVSPASEPPGIEEELSALNASLYEEVGVLAYELTRGLPEFGPMEGITAEIVHDGQTLDDALLVSREVWGGSEISARERESQLKNLELPLGERGGFRVVSYSVAGRPISTGGCTLTGDVAKFWGSGTIPAARGTGAYRKVVAERMRTAADLGATLALVKARVDSSGPILRRLGFEDHGVERCYELSVGGLG